MIMRNLRIKNNKHLHATQETLQYSLFTMEDAYIGNKSPAVGIHQRRYLGSKTKLLAFIEEILKKEKVSYKVFADIFAGTGVVADHFSNHADVIVNDILESNYQSYIAYFGEVEIREDYLKRKLDEYNNLDTIKLKENYFSTNFSDTYFDRENSLKIGNIREDIEIIYKRGDINERERAYLITSLIYALDRIANTVGHYDAFRKVVIPKKSLILRPLSLSSNKRNSKIYKKDANELVRTIKSDVVYIDPPYNSRQYSDAYHLLENIAEWKKQSVYGVAKKIDRSHLKSRYSLKTAGEAFSDLINKVDAKYILVSYNDMGTNGDARSQSRITDHEIASALERRGKVSVYEKTFRQFTTGKSRKHDLKERIFFCRVSGRLKTKPATIETNKNYRKQRFIKSPLNYTGGKYRLLPQLSKYFPSEIETFYDVFCGGANVGVNSDAENIMCIDKNKQVIQLLSIIQRSNFEELHQAILLIIEKYSLSQSYIWGYQTYNSESSRGLGSFNKDGYLKLRSDYNLMLPSDMKTILLLVLIMYSFNNQIRFNSKGEFNLPVGKRDYNGSSRKNIAAFNRITNDKTIKFRVGDFRSILKRKFSTNDFVYLDPPYLLGLATYNEAGGWNEQDEAELHALLDGLSKKYTKFALSNVIKHKGRVNKILRNWILKNDYNIHILDFHYQNSNYQSSARHSETVEVLVTNY